MKLITVKNSNGDLKYINPHYVRSIKQSRSDINNDWCVTIELDNNEIETVLSKTESGSNQIMIDITDAMKSIS